MATFKIAGITVKQRIGDIMTGGVRPRPEPYKKLLLATLAAAALAALLTIGLMRPAAMRAQSPQTAAPLHFNAASIKWSSDQDLVEARPKRTIGRFRWHTQLLYLLGYAYHMEWWRISDVPGSGAIYEVEATTDPDATEDQVRLMLQSLLVERFHLVTHRQTKDAVDGFRLSVGPGGPKLQEAKADQNADPLDSEGWVSAHLPDAGAVEVVGQRATIARLTEQLQRLLSNLVIDQTGLAGRYDFTLQFAKGDDPNDYSAVAAAVKQLGLKLEKYKGPVEFLVVDRIEKLVEN